MSVKLLKSALYNCTPDSGASVEYCKGIVVGVVSTLMHYGQTFDQALDTVATNMPENARDGCVPDAWTDAWKRIWTRAEITRSYDINPYGMISSPGKFGGNMLYAVYFWNRTMESGENETVYDGDTPISLFCISPEDIGIFPELNATAWIGIAEDSQGFVTVYEWESEQEMRDALEQIPDPDDLDW